MKKNVKRYLIIILLVLLTIFYYPLNVSNAREQQQSTQSTQQEGVDLDNIFNKADEFIQQGESSEMTIDEQSLKEGSDLLYNILLAILMVIAVIIGIILGIQFMVATVESKAKVKESLIAYFIGCIVIFGAFGIWRIVVSVGNSF